MIDPETLRTRHVQDYWVDECPTCKQDWPCDTTRALDGWHAAEQDAAWLAEVLRTAPVAVQQTPQTAAWESRRHRALLAHRERTEP